MDQSMNYETRRLNLAIAAAKEAIRDRAERTYSEPEITELATAAVAGVTGRYRLQDRTFDDFRFGYEAQHIMRSPAYANPSSVSKQLRTVIEAMGYDIVPKRADVLPRMYQDPRTGTLFAYDAMPDGTIIAADADYIRRKMAGDPTVDADYPTPPVVSVTVNSYGDDFDAGAHDDDR